jgi:hypothetical protein
MLRKPIAVTILALLVAAPVAAQTVGTPVFMAPYRAFDRSEFSATFSDPGAGWALEGAYRYGSGKFDVGFRLGFWNFSRPGDDDTRLLVGADLRFRVLQASDDFPLDGAFTAGLGGILGDNSTGLIPFGLSLGRRVELEGGTSFVPYLQPVIAPTFGDDSEVLVSLGLGVDIRLGRTFDLRVGGGIGDIEGIAIGFAWVR